MKENSSKNILKTIKDSRFPILISHEKPDGDTLGASLAFAQYLTNLGKPFVHFCVDAPPSYFGFLPKIEDMLFNQKEVDFSEHDLFIIIDCGSIERTGLNEILNTREENKKIVINIDHHQSNNLFGDYNLVNQLASSTSEIVFQILAENGIKIDKYMATCLLTGILSDTMNFTNAATTEESMKISAELIKLGARANQIISGLTQNKNLSALKFWGTILDRAEIHPKHNFAYVIIEKGDIIANQIRREEIDGIANFFSLLSEPDFIVVLTEEDDEFIKGSLRTTKDIIDLSEIARNLGGGGHKKAAGFKIKKSGLGDGDWKKTAVDAIINKLKVNN
ncbi:MAG: DHH family phosphoesterase [Patescibacteria group bacterium]|nr:DHH family phosphoesterase [Patescibacteria group bacterium]